MVCQPFCESSIEGTPRAGSGAASACRKETPAAEREESPKQEADGEAFLRRWSRRKTQARQGAVEKPPAAPAAADPQAPPPDVPSPEDLTFDSDYRPFFHPKVAEDVRRAALKKLFSDPHFNVMDGLDVYIDDYGKTEPIPAAMLAGLKQAQNIFQWAKEDAEERRRTECDAECSNQAAAPEQAALDEIRSSDAQDAKTSEDAPLGMSRDGNPERS